MTIVDNPVLNKILVAGLRKEKIEVPEANMSFSELKNTTEPDADTVQAEWDKYQLEHAADHKTNNMSYEDAVHKFSGEYGKKMGTRKKGFWSKFWGGLFSRNVEKILKK